MSGLESYTETQFPINRNDHQQFREALKNAHASLKLGDLQEAKEKYLAALTYSHSQGTELFELYKNVGNIDLTLGDLDSAEENYNRAYALNADSDVLMVNFGSLAIIRQDLSKAVQCFRRAVELNKQNANAWVGLASMHREFGDHELAWANAERAIEIDPTLQVVAHLLMDWAFRDNDIERAIRSLDIYCRYKPEDLGVCTALAKMRYLMGRLDEAEANLISVLKRNPDYQEAEELFAIVRKELQQRTVRAQ